jgi:hypothetical protein
VLSDPVLMEQIREGEAVVEAGETVSLEESPGANGQAVP